MIWVDMPGTSVKITERGIEYDRQFVIVGADNMFVAQRSAAGQGIAIPQMCLISSHIEDDTLIVNAPDMPNLNVSLRIHAPVENVEVWGNASLSSIYMGEEAKNWFTRFLSRFRKGEYRLFRMATTCRRASKGGQAIVANQDAFPFTIGSQASLLLLSEKLRESGLPDVEWDRFRPSLVLEGNCEAHAEDSLARIVIDGIPFNGKTLCSRCPIVNTDQATGKLGKEPLKLLATYRRGYKLRAPIHKVPIHKLGMVFFTRNFDHLECGHISPGSRVHIEATD